MSTPSSKSSTNSQKALATQVSRLIGLLTAEFLLGMAVTLIDMSAATSGLARTTYNISLILHILIGFGLLVGAIVTVRPASKAAPQLGRLAWTGLALIAGTFVTGVLAMELENDGWSFMMAVGFIASYLVYWNLLFRNSSHGSEEP